MSILDRTCCYRWSWRTVFCLLDNVCRCRVRRVCDLHDTALIGRPYRKIRAERKEWERK